MISVYGTSNKPHIWKRVYDSVSQAQQEFEFIFSGPEQPADWDLPHNFKWLKTNVKPMQALEASYIECQGEYILCIADDAVVESWEEGRGFLDVLMYHLQSEMDRLGHDKIVMAPKFKDKGRTFTHPFIRSGDCRGPNNSLNGGLMKKYLIDEIGGFDKRFIGPFGQIDVSMEIWSRGGFLTKTNYAVLREQDFSRLRICPALKYHDRPLLNDLWMRSPYPEEKVPGDKAWGYHVTPTVVLSKERTQQTWQHFEKEGILEHSQGDMVDGFGWD